MRYVLLIHGDPAALERRPEAEREAHMQRWADYGRALEEAGVVRDGAQLLPAATGKVVRRRDGRRLVSDGPFAETREQLGGYLVLEVGSLDEAVEWAGKCPAAALGTIEVRPLLEEPARA